MPAPAATPFAAVLPSADVAPIVVAGNGPVGQTTALLLARWGLPVLLVDARPHRDPIGSKSLCQARDVLDIWEIVGAGHEIADTGVTWSTARTFYRDTEVSRWSFVDPGRSPFPPFVNLGQQVTEEILDRRIAAAGARIDVRWDHEVTAVEQDDDEVRLTVRTSGGQTTLTTPYVVFASGSGSRDIRKQLGLGFRGYSLDDFFLICDIRADLPGWEHERRFYFDPEWNPGRQVLIHACPDSTYRIDWQVPGDYDLAEDERTGGLDRRIRQVIGDRPYEMVWHSAYRFHSRRVEHMRVGRALLAGDCAHIVSPFGARGLNTGVFDAENLAWKLAFVVNGWADESLLDSYSSERVAATEENIDVTTGTNRFLVPADDAERRARTAALEAALADPDPHTALDSGRFAEPFWYVASELTTPDPARPFAGRPPKGEAPPPAPGVVLPDLPVALAGRPQITRLRELARLGVLLLAAPGADVAAAQAVLKEVTAAPATVAAMADLTDDGSLAATLGAADGEIWVVRPDAYVAAVVGEPGPALAAAVRRCLANPVT